MKITKSDCTARLENIIKGFTEAQVNDKQRNTIEMEPALRDIIVSDLKDVQAHIELLEKNVNDN